MGTSYWEDAPGQIQVSLESTSFGWLGNVSVFPQMSWKNWLDQGSLGFSAETDASTTRIEISTRMDGWSCWLESAKVNQTVRGLSKMVIRRRGVASSYLHCNPIISVH